MLYVIKGNDARKEGQDEHPCRERERERLQQTLGTVQMSEHQWQRLIAPATGRIQAVHFQRCQGAQPQGMNPQRARFCSAPAQGSDRLTVLSLWLKLAGTLVLHIRQVPMQTFLSKCLGIAHF